MENKFLTPMKSIKTWRREPLRVALCNIALIKNMRSTLANSFVSVDCDIINDFRHVVQQTWPDTNAFHDVGQSTSFEQIKVGKSRPYQN